MAKGTYRAQRLNRAGERVEAEHSARKGTGERQASVDADMTAARAILRTRSGATVTGPAYTRTAR